MFWRARILISEYLSADRISESKITVSVFFVLDPSYTKVTLNFMYEVGKLHYKMSDDGKGSLREAESFKLNLHSWRGGEDLTNLKLMYFFTWRHRKTSHCFSWKQQFHKWGVLGRRQKPVVTEAILCLQGQHEERNWETTEEAQCPQNTKPSKELTFPEQL